MAKGFLPQEIIRRKRDGETLSSTAIKAFIKGVIKGTISEGQIGAFTMASLLKGMSEEETIHLTLAMRDSGKVLEWAELDHPLLDKHSTGGVGDNVSLMLAPILAACGAAVPMISGRGLGHTGGTLDKLDAIPGYQTEPDEVLFRRTVREVGCAIIGQTQDLAPADKKIYAIRDITATVDSPALITASILSKKLAAGLQGLVLDVKFGDGAVMSDIEEAKALAEILVRVANGAGLPTTALLSNMDEPLADCVGNAVEVQSAIDFFTGKHQPQRLKEVVSALASHALINHGLANDASSAFKKIESALASGHAAERFEHMVHALGGPSDILNLSKQYLPASKAIQPVCAEKEGYISTWQTRELALNVVEMGGGRKHPDDVLNYAVGISGILPIGTKVAKGEPLAFIHAASAAEGQEMVNRLNQQVTMHDDPPETAPLIAAKITR